MQNWVITRADDGVATLLFDRAGATANTLSQQALAELNEALDIFDRDPPKGVIVRSGKASASITTLAPISTDTPSVVVGDRWRPTSRRFRWTSCTTPQTE